MCKESAKKMPSAYDSEWKYNLTNAACIFAFWENWATGRWQEMRQIIVGSSNLVGYLGLLGTITEQSLAIILNLSICYRQEFNETERNWRNSTYRRLSRRFRNFYWARGLSYWGMLEKRLKEKTISAYGGVSLDALHFKRYKMSTH